MERVVGSVGRDKADVQQADDGGDVDGVDIVTLVIVLLLLSSTASWTHGTTESESGVSVDRRVL